MIEIKNVIFTNSKANFLNWLLCFVNHLLPLRIKFSSESFVALIDKKKEALITLEKDSKSKKRFKITKLILEENSTSTAIELINYAITRYRAMGAQSFYVVVDELQADLLNIFKNELNFRNCGIEYLYKINQTNTNYSLFLKPFKKEFLKAVCDFFNENINSFNRFLFSREQYQFLNNCLKYVFIDEETNKFLGYFEVATKNKIDFYINFSIDFTYNIYIIDAIKMINSKLKRKYKKFNLYIKIKDYFMNSKELLAILNENNFEFVSKSQILAKDYYKLQKNENLFKNAKIIFNDPTTA